MRKITQTIFSKCEKNRIVQVCSVIFFLMMSITSLAQGYVTLGTQGSQSGNTSPSPVNGNFNSRRIQIVYTAAELTAAGAAAGNIERLAWDVSVVYGDAGGFPNYTVKMAHITTPDIPSTTYITPLTTVKNPYSYIPVSGFNDITFDTPFNWNGTDNILVDICFNTAPYLGSSSTLHGQCWNYTGVANNYRSRQADGNDLCGNTTANQNQAAKPRVRFYMQQQPPCAGTPEGGTVTGALERFICNGAAPGVITVTGATPPAIAGISHQWEESIDAGTNWADATGGTGATTPSYTPPNYAGIPIQYRLKVTCANGGGVDYSEVLIVNSLQAPSTQASALMTTNVGSTSFTVTWTNGNGARRHVLVSTSPITAPVNATGIAAYTAATLWANTGQQIVYDGTGTSVTVTGLTCGTYYVKVFEYSRCGSGPYDVYFNTTDATNALTIVNPLTAGALPIANNFTGFTGANLGVAVPGWYEANGTTNVSLVPVDGNSDWTGSTALTIPTAKVNLYDDAYNAWVISPKMAIAANSRLKFKAAITNYDVGSPDANGMQGTDDKLNILVSTDGCGAVWTVIHTFNAANTTTLTNVLTDFTIPLNYTGQTIQIAFQGVDGPTNDSPDYDFHIGNIIIEEVPQCDVPVVAAPANITKNGVTIAWTAPTVGTPTGYEYVVSTTATAPAAAGTPVTGVSTSVDVASLLPSTDYYVYVRTVCGTDFSDWSVVQTFTTMCDYPDILTSGSTSVCGLGTSTLSATSSAGTIKWYGAQTGGDVLATGTSFETPEISENTTFYVTTANVEPAQAGGARPAPTATAGTTPSDYGLVFDVHSTFVLNSVDVFLKNTAADELTIILTDAQGTELEEITVNVPVGDATTPVQHTITLGWTINPGIGYRILATDGPNMVRESALGGFPYYVGEAATVTGGYISGASSTYYYFYNWNFTGECAGPRVPVAVTVTDAPAITIVASEDTLCAGESTSLSVTSANAGYTYEWMPGSLTGAAQTVTPTETTVYVVTATDTATGCVEVGEITITVNPLPIVTAELEDVEVCEGSIQALTFEAGVVSTAISGTEQTASVAQSTSNTLGPNPLQNYWGGVKQQWIYTAAELTAMGFITGSEITAISLDLATANTSLALNSLSIKMKNTTQAAFSGTSAWITEMITVRDAANYTPVVGLNNFALTTPFVWDGTSNLAVQMSYSNNSSPSSGTNSAKFSATSFVSTIYYRADSTAPAAMEAYTDAANYTYSTRNNVTFTVNNPLPVVWSPVTNLFTDANATIAYTGTNASTVYTKPVAAITYTATAETTDGCSSSSTTDITISVTPAPAAEPVQEFCGATTVANLETTSGTEIKWYLSPVGGTALTPATVVTDGYVYYASQTVDGCESMTRTAVTAEVNVIAAPTVTEDVQEFCNAATIADLDATGTGVLWYDSATGGTALAETDVIAEGISLYYASQTVDGCESVSRAVIAVFVNVVDAPTAEAAQSVCNEGTVADLTIISGEGILWYDDATEGTALDTTVALVDGETYYASQTIDGCESLARVEVTVTINVIDAPMAEMAQSVCTAGTVADLTVTSGENVLWYDAAEGGTLLDSETVLADGVSYFASQTVNGCESLDRAEVVVTINVTAAPEPVLDVVLCNSGTLADLEVIGEGILWYAAATGGEALDPSMAVEDGVSYFASQTIDGCESADRAEVVAAVNVVNAPTGEATQEVEENAVIADIVIDGVTGTVTWYATLEDAQAGTNPLESTIVLEDGENYFATQTVEGCTSAAAFEVTVEFALDVKGFDSQSFTYFPNPVKNVLTLSYTSNIDEVTVYNMLGQAVMIQSYNALEAKLDMSGLSDGTYILTVVSGQTSKTVKVIKKQ